MDAGLWLHWLYSQTTDQTVLVAQKIIAMVRLVGTLNEIKIICWSLCFTEKLFWPNFSYNLTTRSAFYLMMYFVTALLEILRFPIWEYTQLSLKASIVFVRLQIRWEGDK